MVDVDDEQTRIERAQAGECVASPIMVARAQAVSMATEKRRCPGHRDSFSSTGRVPDQNATRAATFPPHPWPSGHRLAGSA